MRCYIYIIGPDEGPYKVGIAGDPWGRMYDLQTANWRPLSVHLAYLLPGDADPLMTEAAAHKALKAKHLRGEWFNGPLPDIASAVLRVTASYPPSRQKIATDTVLTLHPLSKR